ncbi:MAG: hypothetical protein R3268_05895, partial [Acidiferrobacterales bacterium]|nr:hypothetical protein [Acidiferrobacterales bacterium]
MDAILDECSSWEFAVTPIRVHLGPMPEMLLTIIGDLLSREPDIVITGRSAHHEDCLREARARRAEVVVAQERLHNNNSC